MFKKPYAVNNSLLEVELATTQIEHKELIIVGFFILQYSKPRIVVLYYNFFTKFYIANKDEELEMDTASLYLALAEKELEDCIPRGMKSVCKQLRSKDCTDSFTADAVRNCLPRMFCDKQKKNMTSESLVFSTRSSSVRKSCLFVVKFTAATTKPPTTWISAVKGSIGEYESRAVMVPGKSIAKFLMTGWILHLQTEVFELKITQLQLLNKMNENFLTFILKD